MIEGKPKRKYTVLSPISSIKRRHGIIGRLITGDKDSGIQRAYKDIQKQAEKLGADALIEWSCNAGSVQVVGGSTNSYDYNGGGFTNGNFSGTAGALPGCQGLAVKWE